MDKAKVLDLIAAAKKESPDNWQPLALDWIYDTMREQDCKMTRKQVAYMVGRWTGEIL